MSKESYIRGFCKVAEAHGIDPVQLAKFAAEKQAQDPQTAGREVGPTVEHATDKALNLNPISDQSKVLDAAAEAQGLTATPYALSLPKTITRGMAAENMWATILDSYLNRKKPRVFPQSARPWAERWPARMMDILKKNTSLNPSLKK